MYAIPCAGQVPVADEEILIGKKYNLHSDVLKEDREYWVYLPPAHDDTTLVEAYPVLYLLDGDWYFPVATGIVSYSRGSFKLPEMIIVGVLNKDRIRDFTPTNAATDMYGKEIKGLEMSGGGADFMRFLKEELIPRIDADFKTTDYRVLSGHSFAGLFATYAFLQDDPLFTAYLLIDPSLWWDEAKIVGEARDFFAEGRDRRRQLYFAEADPKQALGAATEPHYEAMTDFLEAMASSQDKLLHHGQRLFTGETHASAGLLGLYQGLSFLFEGHRPPDSTFSSPTLLEAHYSMLSGKWGGTFLPPQSLVRNLGFGAQYGERNYDKAIPFFEMNLRNYPASADGYRLMGEVYEMKGDSNKAREFFLQALELTPNNQALRGKVKE